MLSFFLTVSDSVRLLISGMVIHKSYFYLSRNHLSFLTCTKYFNKIETLKLKLGEHRKTKHFLCEYVKL